MRNFEYQPKAAITSVHFVAAECNCKAGCFNEPSPSTIPAEIGKGRIICSHGMTLPVSLSLALYNGLAAQILTELRLRLKKENVEDQFHEDKLIALQHDINCLLKAAGITSDPESDRKKSIVQCLDVFAVGTDQPKPPPKAPDPHDLGLLREKCRYMSATKKAEKAMFHDSELEILDLTNGFGNHEQSGEPILDVDYSRGQKCIDTLSLVFDLPELLKLSWTKNDGSGTCVPIGHQLLRE